MHSNYTTDINIAYQTPQQDKQPFLQEFDKPNTTPTSLLQPPVHKLQGKYAAGVSHKSHTSAQGNQQEPSCKLKLQTSNLEVKATRIKALVEHTATTGDIDQTIQKRRAASELHTDSSINERLRAHELSRGQHLTELHDLHSHQLATDSKKLAEDDQIAEDDHPSEQIAAQQYFIPSDTEMRRRKKHLHTQQTPEFEWIQKKNQELRKQLDKFRHNLQNQLNLQSHDQLTANPSKTYPKKVATVDDEGYHPPHQEAALHKASAWYP